MASRLLILIFPCLFNTSPKIPTKFFHAAHLGNLNQIINQYGDEKSALSAVQDLEEYSWNYRKCFFEEMSKTARLYRDQGKGDHWVFTAIEVFDKWIKDNPSPPISELPFLDFNVVEWVLPLAIGEFGEAHECVRFAKLYVKYKGEIQFRPSEESSPPKRDLSGLREAALHSTIVDLCDNPNLWVSTLDPQANPSSQLIYMVCYAYTPPMEHEKLEAWADTQSFMQMGGTLQLMRGKQT